MGAAYDDSGLVMTADGLHLEDQFDFWSESQSPWLAGDHPDFSKRVPVLEHKSNILSTRASPEDRVMSSKTRPISAA